MRTLSTQEIAQIDHRLESLKIQYLEIFHELRDHYFTELEKKPVEEFEVTFKLLNETFAWSVVKGMEKNLYKVAGKQIKEMQWDMIKFWKSDNTNFYITPLAILFLIPTYFFLEVEGVVLLIGIIGLIGIPVSFIAAKDEIKIIPRRFTFQLKTAFSHQFFSKNGIFLHGAPFIYTAINNWNSSNPGVVGSILIWFLAIPYILHYTTLIRIALDWKLKKQLK
jgi:hypothetical protein